MLHELLTINNESVKMAVIRQCVILSGLAGIGKSELARMYASQYSEEYDRTVIWFNAEERYHFKDSLVDFIERYDICIDGNISQPSELELMQMIYDNLSDKKCLIILDNVDLNRFSVFEYFPKHRPPNSVKHTLLVTSRCNLWESGIAVVSLDVLSVPEAIQLVRHRVPFLEDEDKIWRLVVALQCHPLALQQALDYINAELSLEEDPTKNI